MTTIAYRDGVMAADTKISSGDDYVADITKIKKVDGYLIGVCGDVEMVTWFHSKFRPEVVEGKIILSIPGSPKVDFEALVVTPEGHVYLYTDTFMCVPLRTFGYAAVGSGTPMALGAMCAGGSAIDAVRAAIRHDSGTGGRVQTITLSRRRKRK